jgi:mRNA interferase MazF
MKSQSPNPQRGEIWLVEFEPQRGAEIGKTRPALVISVRSVGYLPLRMVVPITDWKPEFAMYSWFVPIRATRATGLTKPSGADGFQCKSFSLDRFHKKIGVAPTADVEQVVASVGLCIGL